MKFIVIGGGLAGVPTAWYLLQAGHEVVLVDRAEALAAEGSHANGAILHAGNGEPWNSPAVVGQLLRWLGREDSPLLLRPGQLPNLIGWGLRFLWYSRRQPWQEGMTVNTRLAVYSRQQMDALARELGSGWDQARRGSLKICRTQESLATAATLAPRLRELGIEVELLDRAGVLAAEPALVEAGDDIVGASHFPQDQSGDPCRFCRLLGERLIAGGGELVLGARVSHLERDGDRIIGVHTDQGVLRGDRYVLAAGADAPLLAGPVGVHLPIRPVKGYAATLPVGERRGAPHAPIIDDDRKVVMTRLGERLRVAGMAEFAGHDRSIRQGRVDAVVRNALASFPTYAASVDPAAIEPWACLRPLPVDGRPMIGPTPLRNLFLNAGAGHLGWTIAAGAGRLAADLAAGQSPEIDPAGVSLDRFGG